MNNKVQYRFLTNQATSVKWMEFNGDLIRLTDNISKIYNLVETKNAQGKIGYQLNMQTLLPNYDDEGREVPYYQINFAEKSSAEEFRGILFNQVLDGVSPCPNCKKEINTSPSEKPSTSRTIKAAKPKLTKPRKSPKSKKR